VRADVRVFVCVACPQVTKMAPRAEKVPKVHGSPRARGGLRARDVCTCARGDAACAAGRHAPDARAAVSMMHACVCKCVCLNAPLVEKTFAPQTIKVPAKAKISAVPFKTPEEEAADAAAALAEAKEAAEALATVKAQEAAEREAKERLVIKTLVAGELSQRSGNLKLQGPWAERCARDLEMAGEVLEMATFHEASRTPAQVEALAIVKAAAEKSAAQSAGAKKVAAFFAAEKAAAEKADKEKAAKAEKKRAEKAARAAA
jgi:hypothetical protein